MDNQNSKFLRKKDNFYFYFIAIIITFKKYDPPQNNKIVNDICYTEKIFLHITINVCYSTVTCKVYTW